MSAQGEREAQGLDRYKGQEVCRHGVPRGLLRSGERPGHDCVYTDARDRLLPEAMRRALAEVPEIPATRPAHELRERRARLDRAFLAHMNRLARERGVVR